jgi:hypothetical protein
MTSATTLWKAFAGTLDVGEDPRTAAVIKLLHNQMLLVRSLHFR